ncbi:fructosamine-3-kinase [Bacillus ectoiniformans]|uniref:phosphotransferase family protein n=1 Tax=Bacillus ectoiniformans TaxID=1494429 RepID=UPI001959F5F9|nr:phosphotransferase [Bacillus ectoiniformans]MBM7650329.1 fructosamine-3-kinase [Bacillus ectoiniformans]
MDIQKVIEELIHKQKIEAGFNDLQVLNGGTASQLYAVYYGEVPRYVIKSNKAEIVKSEANFLRAYQHIKLVPQLIYVDLSHPFLLYSFVKGQTDVSNVNKKSSLQTLVQELINQYQPVTSDSGWGWWDEPSDSWKEFLLASVFTSKQIIGTVLNAEDTEAVIHLLQEKTWSSMEQPYLLHGDCGFHNFVYIDKELNGVIDPIPVLGDPIYDLVYAYCSSPVDLTKETILSAYRYLTISNHSEQEVWESVVIGLYLRIAACIKHHPEDLEKYLEAWGYWRKIAL